MRSLAGSSVRLTGTNSIEAGQTEGESNITLEGNEEGAGTKVGSIEVGGNMHTSGNHTVDDLTADKGSNVTSAGGLMNLCKYKVSKHLGLCIVLQNLQGLQIKNLTSRGGSTVNLKGRNSIDAGQTEGDSNITLEGDEEGAGTKMGSMEVGGNFHASGSHTVDDLTAVEGSNVNSAGGLILMLI